MAATKDWTGLISPCSTQYWVDGEAAAWTVHTPPRWAKRVTVINHGASFAYVAKPALSGATNAAGALIANDVRLEPHSSGDGYTGASVTLALVNVDGEAGRDATAELPRTFSTFGVDGAAHKFRFIFDHGFGGA